MASVLRQILGRMCFMIPGMKNRLQNLLSSCCSTLYYLSVSGANTSQLMVKVKSSRKKRGCFHLDSKSRNLLFSCST